MQIFASIRWSPYVVGACIGILSWFTFLLSDQAIGCSTAYVKITGIMERMIRGDRVLQRSYFKRVKPNFDWSVMLVVGIVIGSFISSSLSGSFGYSWIPSRWYDTFGDSIPIRIAAALCGGLLMGFAARWAGGCTSGHGISGTLQLAVSSWIATIGLFLGGVVTAKVLFALFA